MNAPTDLEALIQHLAGRAAPSARGALDPADSLSSRLDDPTSDASRFLDEIRQKTRALLDPAGDDLEAAPGQIPPEAGLAPAASAAVATQVRRGSPRLWVGLVVGVILGGGIGGLVTRAPDRGAARLADELSDRLAATIRDQLAAQPAKGAPGGGDLDAVRAALGQLADRLDRIDRGFAALATPPDDRRPAAPERNLAASGGPAANPALAASFAALGADLATIRRELGLSEAATGRQIQEMRTVLQEVNTVVRRVLSRPQADNVATITGPLMAVAVQSLTHNLQHPSAQVRGEAVEQLIRIGAPARGALPALQERLNREPDPNIRTAIQAAISVLSTS